MIAIIDYGMGNLGSVAKAFSAIGAKAKVTQNPRDLDEADKIVLPGVGAFAGTMASLKKLKLIPALVENINAAKPYLGLCLGMQILFEESEEGGKIKGLGIFEGKVKRFKFTKDEGRLSAEALAKAERTKDVLKVPHMGWNQIKLNTQYPIPNTTQCPLLKGIPDGAWMYFVHSYYASPKDKSIIAAATDYGVDFTSMIWKDNIYATQFHPEKSQKLGMKILENFVEL